MTRLVAKVSLWVALTTVIVVAGVHWVYYLMNWEWNRAAIAGTAFVAGSVLGSTALLLGRMRRVERRIDLLLATRVAPGVAQAPPGPEPRPSFPWLVGSSALPTLGLVALVPWAPPEQGVFIPIFLAAGLGISAAAGVVERVAAARYEPRPAIPDSDLVPAAPGFREVLRATPRRVLVAIPLLSVLIVTGLVSALWFGGHYWATPIGPGVTTVTVEVDSRGLDPAADSDVVESVGRYCSLDSGVGVDFVGVRRDAESWQLRVSPLLDHEAQDRFIGCLEDAVLEWHRLTVTDTALSPATGN